MGVEEDRPADSGLTVLVTVRCLECGEIYAKPRRGGTVEKNPGCPSCGYVGWLSVSLPSEAAESRRSDEGRRPHPHVQRG
jgi:predicted  nucleic acid-binding Zn-ribbon protein